MRTAATAQAPLKQLPFDVVENPVTGERIVFTETGADSAGERLRFDFFVRPGGGVPVAHRHTSQHEHMRGVRGSLQVTVDGRDVVVGPGDELTIDPGMTHQMANRGDEEAMCEVEYRPAGRNEDWFRLLHGFAYRHGRNPSLLDLAPFLPAMSILVPNRPEVPQRILIAYVLRPIAILLGRRRRMLDTAQQVYGRPINW
jgi:mannose-6-phosphate isomerase-like protein (cupin superfamily)